ncbi:glycosyltransferase family 4 protein [Pseudobutyrivibrio ruminis]|uniref:Glycosyl transferases group 1 n=1 Tax=Pseudobutyrivibrio ruminis DSM 9787 TaxID=1123011 RepID=A0A285S8Q5_9FIRM|nr:glycosyltransferase [Pseudobutyrivibrio ruminis]SOC03978.1 Glycosyl transferases group 1 [Pseudobutyrivibrio ruminis DSM 9787]
MKNKKTIGVIGHFGFGKELLNGQTVKTKTVTKALEEKVGSDEIIKVDTHGGIIKKMTLPFCIIKLLKNCRNIIIFPAHNGVRVIAPMLVFFNQIYKRKLHYAVIGGWLPQMCINHKLLVRYLRKIDAIYVETTTMEDALKQQNFENIVVMPNFKDLNILEEDELIYNLCEPFALCTFSRVMKEKGIEDAVNAVKKINKDYNRIVCTLDIYGQIDDKQVLWFQQLMDACPDYIKYKGTIPFDKSTEILKNYYVLLFPTKFYTEGIPGTIIDAYAAGLPVISSRWESFDDVVEDGVSGIGYNFEEENGINDVLEYAVANPSSIKKMKKACIAKAKNYTPRVSIEKIKML